jgi:predicted nucleic acid-binding protein
MPLMARVWGLRENFTSYDALYLALAEQLGATLTTGDRALRSARLQRGQVEVL